MEKKKTKQIDGMKLTLLIVALFLTSACSNKRSSTVTPTNATNTANRYVFNGTNCIDTTTNTAVANNLCGTQVAQQPTYQNVGGQCFDQTGMQVDPSLCGLQGQLPQQQQPQYPQQQYPQPQYGSQCFGTFQSMNGTPVYCAGTNCSGTYLINPTSGQYVYCQ